MNQRSIFMDMGAIDTRGFNFPKRADTALATSPAYYIGKKETGQSMGAMEDQWAGVRMGAMYASTLVYLLRH